MLFTWMFCIFWTSVGSRFVWAAAQPYILWMEDGSLVLESEVNYGALGDEEERKDDELDREDGGRRIPLGILPSKLGVVWESTGSPIGGVIVVAVLNSILVSFINYKQSALIG